MITIHSCPACDHQALLDATLSTNVTADDVKRLGSGLLVDSRFALCPRCELIFARNRQDDSEADDYYRAFAVLEKRDYAVYPPPGDFVDAQTKFSQFLLDLLDRQQILHGNLRVLNIRCELGIHLARLRDHYGVRALYGLDHFESNLRYAREDLGLEHIAWLHPAKLTVPFAPVEYDLILANHQLTHALAPAELTRRLKQWLAPKGLLILYNELDHAHLFRDTRFFRQGMISYHKQLLTQRSLENICRLNGLEPRLLVRDAQGMRWASGKHSMIILAHARPPLPANQLDPAEPKELLRMIRRGERIYRFRQARRNVQTRLRHLFRGARAAA
jgi:hypothetical protein